MSEVLQRTIRTMWIMDDMGHSSYGWDAQDDHWVLPMIRRKMAEGFIFWIVRRPPPSFRLQEIRLQRVEDIGENRHIIIRDEDARELFEQGRIGIVTEADDEDIETVRPARTAEEVVANDTIAHRGLRGG